MKDKQYVDLHIHTIYSDGSFAPDEVVRFAKSVGLSAISITDHDTVAGIPQALEEGKKCDLEVIPGVELSAELVDNPSGEMHILGYYIDWQNTKFQESLNLFSQARKHRGNKILSKLQEIGIKIDEARLIKIAGMGNIGRLHFAKLLVEGGFCKNISDAFDKFLGFDRPAYVPKLKLKPEEAINMILEYGGIPVLAHPHYGSYNNKDLIKELVEFGLKGIEIWHSKHPKSVVQKFSNLADQFGLLVTGGSDCHGELASDTPIMGKVKVPYKTVVELIKLKAKIDKHKPKI